MCCECCDCSTNQSFPCLSASSRASLLPETENTETGPANNPAVASECSSERKSHTSLTLSQKLEMIVLGEESMSKAELGKMLATL